MTNTIENKDIRMGHVTIKKTDTTPQKSVPILIFPSEPKRNKMLEQLANSKDWYIGIIGPKASAINHDQPLPADNADIALSKTPLPENSIVTSHAETTPENDQLLAEYNAAIVTI